MPVDELCRLSAIDAARLIARKQLSPVELTEAVLTRADRLQNRLNCFITLCSEQAMQAARAAEQDVMHSKPLGLLHGVPFSVKDLVDTAGVRTTYGVLPFRDNVPTKNAVVIDRLIAQGGIMIGKTTTPEFGSQCITRSPLFGNTPNAWDQRRSAGGSSGGAAVAVASGIGALAVATDGGGSTRIPAACNGVVGFKQSLGVIPHSQAMDGYGNQTYVTPTSRTVEDTALMLQSMAGAHACDPWSMIGGNAPVNYLDVVRNPDTLAGKTIRYCLQPPGKRVSADVEAAFHAALERLKELGARLEPFDGANFDVESTWRTVNHTVWRTRFSQLVKDRRSEFSDTFIRQIESASAFSAEDYQQAMFQRTTLFRRVEALLHGAVALITPTIMRTALPVDQDLFQPIDIDGVSFDDIRTNFFPWTMPFNMTGHPAVSMPAGFGRDGLPTAVQFVGSLGNDAELLRVASAFERATALHRLWPEDANHT